MLLISLHTHFFVRSNSTAGESERVLRQLFDDAKKSKPSIIFLDELDALVGWHGCPESAISLNDGEGGAGVGTVYCKFNA